MGHTVVTFTCFESPKQYFALKELSSEFYRLKGKYWRENMREAF